MRIRATPYKRMQLPRVVSSLRSSAVQRAADLNRYTLSTLMKRWLAIWALMLLSVGCGDSDLSHRIEHWQSVVESEAPVGASANSLRSALSKRGIEIHQYNDESQLSATLEEKEAAWWDSPCAYRIQLSAKINSKGRIEELQIKQESMCL